MHDPVFPYRRELAHSRLRVVLFPFAGGSAAVYRAWQGLFGDDVEVCAFEPPGHGARAELPPVKDWPRAVDAATSAVQRLADRPLAFFGHSLGGRLAFEVSKHLPRSVVHLFVSAAAAPDVPVRRRWSSMSDAELRSALARFGGTPPEVLADDDVMSYFLPAIRADFTLVERYRPSPDPAPCPVTAFGAVDDAEVRIEDVRGWERFAHAGYRFVELEGGHFYLGEERARIVREVTSDLRRHV